MNIELLKRYIENSHLGTVRNLAIEIGINEQTLYTFLRNDRIHSKYLSCIFKALNLTNEQILKLFE